MGNTAIVGSGISVAPVCARRFAASTRAPSTTIKVVDLTSPSAPRVAATIPVIDGGVANDVALVHMSTSAFTGELAAVALVRCNSAGNYVNRGVAYYDVTDRGNPRFLGRYIADQNQSRGGDPPCTGVRGGAA